MSLLSTEADLDQFTFAAGFQSAATACGLKKSGALDLLMVWSEHPLTAAGV